MSCLSLVPAFKVSWGSLSPISRFPCSRSYRCWFSVAKRVRVVGSSIGSIWVFLLVTAHFRMLLPSVACVRLDFRDRSSSGFFFAGNTLFRTGCCHLNPSFLLWELETEASPPPVVWSLLETEPPLRIWGLLIVGFRVLKVWCLAVSTVTPTMLERPWCGLSSFLAANSVCALPLPLRQPAPEKHGL